MAQVRRNHDDDEPVKRNHDDEPHAQPKPALAPGMTIGVKGEPIEDGERDPDTIAEEQRRRSAEIEAKGPEAYMREHSTPIPEEDKFKKVVAPPQVEHHEEHRGRR